MDTIALLIAATLNAGTVLAFASLGLLIGERSGILNLGAEGMMLVAAIAGFAVAVNSGSPWLGFAAGAGVDHDAKRTAGFHGAVCVLAVPGEADRACLLSSERR